MIKLRPISGIGKYFQPASRRLVMLWLLNYCVTAFLCAQDITSSKTKDIQELKLKLNDDGSRYIKFNLLGQLWVRYNESNPGTTVVKEAASNTFDIGIRRLRFQLFGQLTNHSFFYLHFGQDNFNFLSSRKFTPFVQDALAEYHFQKKGASIALGGGLTIAGGLSRFTQPQLPNILSVDLPIFAFPSFDLTDQAARKLSVYARGQLAKLDYRLVVSNPFPVTTSGVVLPALSASGYPLTANANFAQRGNHLQYQGLFIWNFLEREPNLVPFMTGSYYGKKNILNLEGGFIWQKNATWSSNDSGQTVNYYALRCWSVAVFYDAPLNREKQTALNAYLGYFNTQYGPGYIRYIGVMNPADGLVSSASYFPGSQGNAFPEAGTGHVLYAQFGYLFQKNLLGKSNGILMAYATLQNATYDRLDKGLSVFNVGANWLLQGNNSKLSLDYQNRPVFFTAGHTLARTSLRKSQLILQYQFFF